MKKKFQSAVLKFMSFIVLMILLLVSPFHPAIGQKKNNTRNDTAILPASIGFGIPGNIQSTTSLSYPSDPSSSIPWSGGTSSVADIQAAFNHARAVENSQLGKSLPMITLPSQEIWNAMSDGEKALWLINQERLDRGVMQLQGVEENVMDVAQYYSDYLLDNDAWGHDADGYSPWDRLNNNPEIGACHDFLSVAENLAVFVTNGTSIPLPIERSVYMWMYDDDCCGWGHRHAVLWYPYNDNSGIPGKEGFLGIGRSNGGPYKGPFSQAWPFTEMIVMNVFDPCSTWHYSVPQVTSIMRANSTPTSAVNVQYIVTFSESVTGVDITDFNLTTSGVTGASVMAVNGSGDTYTVTIHTGFSNGTLRLNIVDDDSIKNTSNTPLGGLGVGNGSFTTGEDYIISKIPNMNVSIGNATGSEYSIPNMDSEFINYLNVLNGPVKVISTNGENIFTTQVVTSGASYNELAGYPVNQFTTEYWFPYYDHGYPNVAGDKMRTWILVGNPDDIQTAEVEIRIGGVLQTVPNSNPPTTTFSIPPGGNVTPRWLGSVGGPVQVRSTNGVNIFASERVFTVPYDSFNEVMGYPASQFTSEYWFPWYDTVYMNTYLLVGNTSASQTATVDIYIGTSQYGPYDIAPNSYLKQRYANTVDGPVRVVASNGVDIVASEYTLSGTQNSFNEVMGYPFDQFDTEYWYPYYDHGYPNVAGDKMRTWILVGNPSDSQTANVQIYIDGVLQDDPATGLPYFSILPGDNVTPRWIGTVAGPVRVVSDIPIFSSERVFTVPTNAFNEFMGIPFSQFTSEYWFTWYDSVYMGNTVVISKP